MSRAKVLDIVIPMAGRGSRFVQAGYKLPKPLIDVNGRPMIARVIENLRPHIPHRFIFLAQKDHVIDHGIREALIDWAGKNSICIEVDGVTEGAACTVLLARRVLSQENDLLIANSDQLVDVSVDDFIKWARTEGLDGAIMVFEDSDPKWSFAAIDKNGFVIKVAEKKPISNLATVGIYYFSPGTSFVRSADQMIAKEIRTNNEFYVCPVYNEMIQSGAKVKTWTIAKRDMHGLGTPEDLKKYLEILK